MRRFIVGINLLVSVSCFFVSSYYFFTRVLINLLVSWDQSDLARQSEDQACLRSVSVVSLLAEVGMSILDFFWQLIFFFSKYEDKDKKKNTDEDEEEIATDEQIADGPDREDDAYAGFGGYGW